MNGRCISLIVCFLLVLSVPMMPAVLYAVEYSLDDLYRIALDRDEKIKLTEEDLYIARVSCRFHGAGFCGSPALPRPVRRG